MTKQEKGDLMDVYLVSGSYDLNADERMIQYYAPEEIERIVFRSHGFESREISTQKEIIEFRDHMIALMD